VLPDLCRTPHSLTASLPPTLKDGRSTLRIKDFVNVWDNIKQCRAGKSVKNCVPLNIKADTFLLMQATPFEH
jgi:hypothetical protein